MEKERQPSRGVGIHRAWINTVNDTSPADGSAAEEDNKTNLRWASFLMQQTCTCNVHWLDLVLLRVIFSLYETVGAWCDRVTTNWLISSLLLSISSRPAVQPRFLKRIRAKQTHRRRLGKEKLSLYFLPWRQTAYDSHLYNSINDDSIFLCLWVFAFCFCFFFSFVLFLPSITLSYYVLKQMPDGSCRYYTALCTQYSFFSFLLVLLFVLFVWDFFRVRLHNPPSYSYCMLRYGDERSTSRSSVGTLNRRPPTLSLSSASFIFFLSLSVFRLDHSENSTRRKAIRFFEKNQPGQKETRERERETQLHTHTTRKRTRKTHT